LNDSIKITDDLYWGMNFKLAVVLLKEDKISKNDIKFFLGYSGWEKNQLKGELDENSWLLSNNFKTKDILKTSNLFWKKKINEFGEYYKIWSNSPDNPNLN
jgi:putative transcriptional regulator